MLDVQRNARTSPGRLPGIGRTSSGSLQSKHDGDSSTGRVLAGRSGWDAQYDRIASTLSRSIGTSSTASQSSSSWFAASSTSTSAPSRTSCSSSSSFSSTGCCDDGLSTSTAVSSQKSTRNLQSNSKTKTFSYPILASLIINNCMKISNKFLHAFTKLVINGQGSTFGTTKCRTTDVSEFRIVRDSIF